MTEDDKKKDNKVKSMYKKVALAKKMSYSINNLIKSNFERILESAVFSPMADFPVLVQNYNIPDLHK